MKLISLVLILIVFVGCCKPRNSCGENESEQCRQETLTIGNCYFDASYRISPVYKYFGVRRGDSYGFCLDEGVVKVCEVRRLSDYEEIVCPQRLKNIGSENETR